MITPYRHIATAATRKNTVSDPVRCSARAPAPTAVTRRRPPATNGHFKRPAPCEAKYIENPSAKNPYTGPTVRR